MKNMKGLNCFYPPNFTFHNDAVHFERGDRRALQYDARAHVELRAVPGAGHSRPVELAFVQRALLMGAFSLCGTEMTGDVEHSSIPNQEPRFGWHIVYVKLIAFQSFGLDRRIDSVCLRRIGLHSYVL